MDTIDAEQVRKLSLFRPLGKWPVRMAFVRMCTWCGGLDIPSHDGGARSSINFEDEIGFSWLGANDAI